MSEQTPQSSYDIVVLGTGAAGLSAALSAYIHGATVGLFEKSATVGGTTAVSGGVSWVPAHNRPDVPDPPTLAEALAYLRAQSNETMNDALVELYARESAQLLAFIEQHTPVRFAVAEGFPDYKPELPGGRPQGGRSFNPMPFDFAQLGAWAERVTAFPLDFSNVGFDAETRARMWATESGRAASSETADVRFTGAALVGGLLHALLDYGVIPQTGCRAVEPLLEHGAVTGAVIETRDGRQEVRARQGVIIATGGFEWNPELVRAFLRGPMHGAISPPHNTGDGLQIAMKAGASLANMREAWWTSVVTLPGDVYQGHPRHRSVRLERARPRSIMINRHGRRFVNEAVDYNSLGGTFHQFDANSFSYPNTPAWIVFDQPHLEQYGFLGVTADEPAPAWFHRSAVLGELAGRLRVDAEAFSETVHRWNAQVASGADRDFQRGQSAYDGWWGDTSKPRLAEQTLGPIDTPPYYAVQVDVGCTGTKGGPRTDQNSQVLDSEGRPIPGLYAAGNAMAAPTGMAYGGAGGTIGPALFWGHRAGAHAAAGKRREDQ